MCLTRGLCWARTFKGHVAAPAMIPINSRRFNVCPLRRTILTASTVPEEGRPAKSPFLTTSSARAPIRPRDHCPQRRRTHPPMGAYYVRLLPCVHPYPRRPRCAAGRQCRARRRGGPNAAGQHVRLRGPEIEAGPSSGDPGRLRSHGAGRRDMRPEPLEARRKRLSRVLSRQSKAKRDGIQLSEAITGDGAAIFRHACGMGLEGIVFRSVSAHGT
jgi:hypothetical protein